MSGVSDTFTSVSPNRDAVISISQHGNPGESAVCCLYDGRFYARRVGPMSNCSAVWFAVEAALDASRPELVRIIHCFGDINEDRMRNPPCGHKDIETISRVRLKWRRGCSLLRVRKHEDRRIELVRQQARRCLDTSEKVWVPPRPVTDRAVESALRDGAEKKAESPVESSLMRALEYYFQKPTRVAPYPAEPWKLAPALAGEHGTMIPQLKIGRYRADVAIVNDLVRLVVEVDGYRYHDMDRDQLERDRQRDRYLMRAGWRVIRFTGREVNQDPDGCAEEIIATLTGLE